MTQTIEPKEIKARLSSINNDMYYTSCWDEDFFKVNEEGHLIVCPGKKDNSINLYKLVRSLVKRGIEPPILFRFDGIEMKYMFAIIRGYWEV